MSHWINCPFKKKKNWGQEGRHKSSVVTCVEKQHSCECDSYSMTSAEKMVIGFGEGYSKYISALDSLKWIDRIMLNRVSYRKDRLSRSAHRSIPFLFISRSLWESVWHWGQFFSKCNFTFIVFKDTKLSYTSWESWSLCPKIGEDVLWEQLFECPYNLLLVY